MKSGALAMVLAVAALLVTACTGSSQPSARQSQPVVQSTPAPSSTANTPTRNTPTRNTPTAGTGTGTAAIATSSNGCAAEPPTSPLPSWARAGFTPPDTAIPHITGAAGNIVGVIWASHNALRSPPPANSINKILWVSRIPQLTPSPLVIRATLADSTRTAIVSVPGGPGPSKIDLPAPGCWTLHLSWSGHTDQLKLRYVS